MARQKQFNSEFRQAAEILGNVSVAWFTAGVIVPLFSPIISLTDFISRLVASLTLAGFSFYGSLELARRGKL